MPVTDLLVANGCLIASTQIAGQLLGAVEARNFAGVAQSTERLQDAVSAVAGGEHSAFRGRVEELAGKALEALQAREAGGEAAERAQGSLNVAIRQLEPPDDEALWAQVADQYGALLERGGAALVQRQDVAIAPSVGEMALAVFGANDNGTPVEEQAIAAVDRLKTELRATTYLEMIPPQYRDWVVKEADKSHPKKNRGLSVDEFRELMAQMWLANREMFQILSGAAQFVALSEAGFLPAQARSPFAMLAITISGSIIGVTMPTEPDGYSNYFYERIGIRQDTTIRPRGQAMFGEPVQIGRRLLLAGGLNSSAVIAAAYHRDANAEVVQRSVVSMTMTRDSVGATLWRQRSRPKSEG